jgi:copper transport protein
VSRVASTPLDDFLNDSSSATDTGELLQRIGLFGSLFGVALAAGLVVFLATAHRGRHQEIHVLLRLVAVGGAAMLVGAAVEVAGVAAIGDLGWADALTDSTGSAPMMRLLGGLLIVLGLFDQTVPIGEDGHDSSDPGRADDDTIVRWIPSSASAFGFVGVALGVMSFWFDGHTVSRGPRAVHAVVNLAHVSAGSVWFGGIVGLVVVGVLRRSTRESTAPDIVRFSSIATVALIVVTLAGALMTLFVIDGFGDLTGTDWGQLLLVKVAAVAITASIGGYNHFVVVPALERSDHPGAMAARARSTLAAEAALLVFVLAVTVFLTTASTN